MSDTDVPPTEDDRPGGLQRFNASPHDEATRALTAVCASPQWAHDVAAARPYSSIESLVTEAGRVVVGLDDVELDAALAGHPRIGERATSESSRREQAAVASADADVLDEIADGNRAYEERFGSVYLVRAAGRGAEELLALLRQRLDNDPAAERAVVRRELAEINALRLQRMVEQ